MVRRLQATPQEERTLELVLERLAGSSSFFLVFFVFVFSPFCGAGYPHFCRVLSWARGTCYRVGHAFGAPMYTQGPAGKKRPRLVLWPQGLAPVHSNLTSIFGPFLTRFASLHDPARAVCVLPSAHAYWTLIDACNLMTWPNIYGFRLREDPQVNPRYKPDWSSWVRLACHFQLSIPFFLFFF